MDRLRRDFRVALINPPYFPRYSRTQRSPGVIRSGTMYYPYWLAHATAVLLQEGFDCYLYDCPAANIAEEQMLQHLESFRPDLCILESSTASSENDHRVAARIKERFPKTRICMVGTHVTALWSETLLKCTAADCVAIGEYDFIVRDLARALFENSGVENAGTAGLQPEQLGQIGGLGFRIGTAGTARGPLRATIENLDELPWIAPVYKRFLESNNYYFSLASYPMVMLIGGRGCVAKCTYCVYPQVMHGHAYRTRSPESIVGEMKWIQENMPEVKEIVFEDDTFTGNRDFARRVAELVKQQGVYLSWFANVRSSVDRESLALLKEAGFRCCAVGFESGDDIILKNMWKGQTVAMQKRFVQNCKELGILVHGCFMFGFPGETQETMQKTLDLALTLSPDSAQFYPVMPFPGTSYYIWAKEKGYLATENFTEWLNEKGGHRCVLNLPGLTAKQVEDFCQHAYHVYYFRPVYFWYKIKQAASSWYEGWRSVKSFLYYLVYLFKKKDTTKQNFNVIPITRPPGWYSVHKMPKGRMFEQSVVLKDSDSNSEDEDLEKLAKRYPHL